jgi:hypothetical protein
MRSLFLILQLILIYYFLPAQKIIEIDSLLRVNSEQMQVKIKTAAIIGDILKYRFGPYKVITSKPQWGTTYSRSIMFKDIEKHTSGQKFSFIKTINKADSISDSISINTESEYIRSKYFVIRKSALSMEDISQLKSSTRNIVSIIYVPGDTGKWTMICISSLKPDSSIHVKKYGSLSNGVINIEIGKVRSWQNQRSGGLASAKGFEFYLKGEAIATIQSSSNTFLKQFVWLKRDIQKNVKGVLAAASVILMSYNNSLENDTEFDLENENATCSTCQAAGV